MTPKKKLTTRPSSVYSPEFSDEIHILHLTAKDMPLANEIITAIAQQLERNGIYIEERMHIADGELRRAMRQLKLIQYFPFIPQIRWRITGVAPPELSEAEKQTIREKRQKHRREAWTHNALRTLRQIRQADDVTKLVEYFRVKKPPSKLYGLPYEVATDPKAIARNMIRNGAINCLKWIAENYPSDMKTGDFLHNAIDGQKMESLTTKQFFNVVDFLLDEVIARRGVAICQEKIQKAKLYDFVAGSFAINYQQLLLKMLGHPINIIKSVTFESDSALLVAVKKCDKWLIKTLLDHGAQINMAVLHGWGGGPWELVFDEIDKRTTATIRALENDMPMDLILMIVDEMFGRQSP